MNVRHPAPEPVQHIEDPAFFDEIEDEQSELEVDEDGLLVGFEEEPQEQVHTAQPESVGSELERAAAASCFDWAALVDGWDGLAPPRQVMRASPLSCALLASELVSSRQRSVVLVTSSSSKAEELLEQCSFFAGEANCMLLPSVDQSPYSGIAPNRRTVAARLAALFLLHLGEAPPLLITSVEALCRRCPPRQSLDALSLILGTGDEVDLTKLRTRLLSCGYAPVQSVEDPGTFAVRGGVVDVFSPVYAQPVRIELDGDEVETLRHFDPDTQRGTSTLSGLYICPVREEILDEQSLLVARNRLRELGDQLDFPTKSLRKVLTELGHGRHFLGIEALMPAFFEHLETPLEFLSIGRLACSPKFMDGRLLMLVDEDAIQHAQTQLFDRAQEQYQQRLASELLAFPPEELYLRPAQWADAIGPLPRLCSRLESDTPLRFDSLGNHDLSALRQRLGPDKVIPAFAEKLKQFAEVYGTIAIACSSSGRAERLLEQLPLHGIPAAMQSGLPARLIAPSQPPAKEVQLLRAKLTSGERFPALGLAIISDQELFGARKTRQSSAKSASTERALLSFRELRPGDFLVHGEHGIGRYEGLFNLEVGGIRGDFLLLRYADEDKLYVPVHRLGSVQKFAGGEQPTRIDRLGSTAWERSKAKVRESVKALAIDLLSLYAERAARPGFAFSTRDEYFRDFESSFPFNETVDQAAAIDAVLEDMAKARPMDRLVCGDVGFGKTEVAVRAAFRAVLDGKQVVVLVPTTILAEQHAATFRNRFANYPVRVESLSRFRKAAETKAILQGVSQGSVDVLIGTHRLLSSDLKFRSLGLLIIDEEHRFGVAHKEKIKVLAQQIDGNTPLDVLSMTATPIPRTLQMSMMGLRDLSVIATPPDDRLAVRTYLARQTDGAIRDAIEQELARGGQVFYLHNRVQTIEQCATQLASLCPKARIAVAHGQMDERKLENVMFDFIRGETDVLVCTTIIESGLDIPNANCLIVSRADTLGLAQLYQLRGRVGRSSQRAHCYLMIPADEKLSEAAHDRLDAITRFTELGSGVQIAQLDLELRGAGNLLGAEQHGSIMTVGLDMYTELLDEAIAELSGKPLESRVEPEVNLPIEAYLPDDYVPDVQLRLMLYKRLSAAADIDELYRIFGEIVDRFGAAPRELLGLRELFEVKLLLRALGVMGVDANNTAITINIGENSGLDPNRVVSLVLAEPKRYVLRQDLRLVRYLRPSEAAALVATCKAYLRELASCCR
ncbi:MAG: transcription-repair coupling factor [Myxococcota bacterium]|jgi:transcription-repair coupling factor (superfamily II helicase)|nr:transcription-repair coupling factor [Myxococcota bacterium]